MLLNIILVDDEENAIITLQSFIKKYIKRVNVVGIANSKKEAVTLIQNTEFDLLLLDINLGDGTGFEVLKDTKEKDFGVIFTTAYDEYAIKAFKYSAIDYLLKPINPEEFIEAIERYKNKKQHLTTQQLNIATSHTDKIKNNKIVINSVNEISFIELEEIMHLKSDKNYTDIFIKEGQKITSTKTLKFYEELLPKDKFIRIHQKHIVNLNYIRKYLKEDGGYVLLLNNTKLEVSRRKKEDLMISLLK